MTIISAKELRNNLDQIVQRARAGETIKVTYRNKPAFVITPETTKDSSPQPGSREAVRLYLGRVNARKQTMGTLVFDPGKPIKQLYREMLDNDPKYTLPNHR